MNGNLDVGNLDGAWTMHNHKNDLADCSSSSQIHCTKSSQDEIAALNLKHSDRSIDKLLKEPKQWRTKGASH